jgi:hypothetical protein
MRNQEDYLQTVDVVAVASPSPPHLALVQTSQNHRFDILKISSKTIGLIPLISTFLMFSMEIPHYIGFGGLTTMARITRRIH